MNNQTPLDHPIPWLYSRHQELSDEQVVAILDFLYELTNAFENRYFGQLYHANRTADEEEQRPTP